MTTKCTSNRHGSHIINNIIIRLTEESDVTATAIKTQEGEVASLASALPPFPNTIISKEWVTKQPYVWQAHLERIADFLVQGEGIWWRQHPTGMEFLDGPQEASSKVEGPSLHSFRSSSLQEEQAHLSKCWKSCLDKQVPLPLLTPRVYHEDGELARTTSIPTCSDDPCQHPTEDDPNDAYNSDSLIDGAEGNMENEDETVVNVCELDSLTNVHEDKENDTQPTTSARDIQTASSSSITQMSNYETQSLVSNYLN